MPPWYIEKNIGIQQYKNDPSLSDDEIAKIAKWADSGAPRGNPADMPPPLEFADGRRAGRSARRTSIVKTQEIDREGRRARLVGRDSERADRADRRSLRRGGRDQGSQRRRSKHEQRPRHRRRALRVPPHDLSDAGARRDDSGRMHRRTWRAGLAGARSGPQRRLLRSRSRRGC